MSDVTIVPSEVFASVNADLGYGLAGEPILEGQALYRDAISRRVLLASSLGEDVSAYIGMSRNAAYAGQPVTYAISDPLYAHGGTVGRGSTIYLSETPGGITTDIPVSGSFVVVLGVTNSLSTMNLLSVSNGRKIATFDSTTEFTFDSTGPVTFDLAA